MERVEIIIPPPLSPGTGDAPDTNQWSSSVIWKPDDPTVLYDPRYRFPPEELLALARAARSRFSVADVRAVDRATASSGRPSYVSALRERRSVADEEAAFEAGWNNCVRAIDELLKDDSDEAAVPPVEETAPEGGVAVVNGAVREAFQGCSRSNSSSSGGVAPQQPEPARPRRKTHRYATNKKKKDRR